MRRLLSNKSAQVRRCTSAHVRQVHKCASGHVRTCARAHLRTLMNILLLRLRLIGDVVFTTPLIPALKRAFPGSRVSYLVEPESAAVVRGNPHLDDVIVVERTRGLRRVLDDVRLARRLRASRFDVVLDLHGGPRSAWLAFATGAGQRIGYDIPGRTWMYTRTVHRPRELRPRHSVSNQWDLLQAIEGWPGGAADPDANPVEMPLDSAVDARIGEALRAAGVQPSDELIVIHVSAGNPFRRWPEPAFTRLVAALAANGDRRRLILSSGPSDRGAAQRITAAARAELGPDRRSAHRRLRRFRPGGIAIARGTEPVVHRRRHGPDAHRRDDAHTDRWNLRADAAGTLGAVAAAIGGHGSGRNRRPAMPAVRSACLRAWRLSLPYTDRAGGRGVRG